MAADTVYTTIRTQTQTILSNITANPKPTYQIDGQIVKHGEYLKQLQETIDWCDRKIAEGDWTEVITRGLT